MAQAASTVVSAYDVASVTLETRDADGSPLGRTTVAEGSPFVSHVAAADETLTTSVPSPAQATSRWPTPPRAVGGCGCTARPWTATPSRSARATPSSSSRCPPTSQPDELAEHAVPLTGTTASYSVGADEVTTELTYDTADGTPAYGVLPHQASATGADVRPGQLPHRLRHADALPGLDAGLVRAAAAGRWRARPVRPLRRRPRRARRAGRRPTSTTFPTRRPTPTSAASGPTGPLSCSRSPARSAPTTRRTRRASDLTEVLQQWTQVDGCAERSAFCFGYDPDWKGVVGQTAAFGSELFNDHHFHYGYFLYAAAVLATDQPSLVEELTAGDDPARRRHRQRLGHRPDAAVAALRRLRVALLGGGHRRVRRRQQPGVFLRGGHRVGGPRSCGPRSPTTRTSSARRSG